MGTSDVDCSELMNVVLGRTKHDTGVSRYAFFVNNICQFDRKSQGNNSGKGLKMWSNPTYNDERGVFCVMMELHGICINDEDEDSETQALIDRITALALLISSQVVFLSKGHQDGLANPESLMDLKFVERIQKYIAVGANISDNFDEINFDIGLSEFREN